MARYPRLVILISHNELKPFLTRSGRKTAYMAVEIAQMAVEKQKLPSFASIISVLSIGFYCVGFLRLELELSEQKNRINALESVVAPTERPSNDPDVKLIKNAPGQSVKCFTSYSAMPICRTLDFLKLLIPRNHFRFPSLVKLYIFSLDCSNSLPLFLL